MWRAKGKWLTDTVVFHSAVTTWLSDNMPKTPRFRYELQIPALSG